MQTVDTLASLMKLARQLHDVGYRAEGDEEVRGSKREQWRERAETILGAEVRGLETLVHAGREGSVQVVNEDSGEMQGKT